MNVAKYIRSIYSIMFLHSVDNNNKYNWIFHFAAAAGLLLRFYASCVSPAR